MRTPFSGFFKKKHLVGLDIGSSSIKLAQLSERGGGGYRLLQIGSEPLNPEAIVDGSILDAGVVIDAINALYRRLKVRQKDVAIGLSGHQVIIKRITLPPMEPADLQESIQWEAEQHIPFDIDEVNIDYKVLTEDEAADEMVVLLVAVQKDKLSDYTGVVSQAGLNPVVVDVDSFALENAYEVNYEQESEKVVALCDIGASLTNVNIIKNGSSIFWRDIDMGGNNYTDALRRGLNLSYEQSEQLKRGENVDGASADDAISLVNEISEQFGNEISKTFDFFHTTSSSQANISKIMLSGGGAQTLKLDVFLAERFGVSVEIVNALRAIDVEAVRSEEPALDKLAPSAAVAVGLALRKEDDWL